MTAKLSHSIEIPPSGRIGEICGTDSVQSRLSFSGYEGVRLQLGISFLPRKNITRTYVQTDPRPDGLYECTCLLSSLFCFRDRVFSALPLGQYFNLHRSVIRVVILGLG